MEYEKIVKGVFIERPNRFVAFVEVDGEATKCHVKNTGRCRELLIPGSEVYLEDFHGRMGNRKMRYSLISVKKRNMGKTKFINMDSQAPNKVVEEALINKKIVLPDFGEIKHIKREKVYRDSRFDFYVEDKSGERAWIEVKGCTLEDEGVVRFPDAPTVRGVKHVRELISSVGEGYKAYIIIVVQMKGVKYFEPNDSTHVEFGDALRYGESQGLHILAYDCNVRETGLDIDKPVKVQL